MRRTTRLAPARRWLVPLWFATGGLLSLAACSDGWAARTPGGPTGAREPEPRLGAASPVMTAGSGSLASSPAPVATPQRSPAAAAGSPAAPVPIPATGPASAGAPAPSTEPARPDPLPLPPPGATPPPPTGQGATGSASETDLGEGDGSDVITIGDSWMLLTDGLGIQVSLERAAMNDYRNYGVPGTQIDQIVAQYEDAKRENPDISTVVMTGGGNNILLNPVGASDCGELGPMCRAIIASVRDKIAALWRDMADDGVDHVFIVGYARPLLDVLQLQRTLEYSSEVTAEGCATAPLHCTFIDSVEVFDGKDHISFDQIHPDAEGYDLLGEAIYDAMVDEGARR